jgi:hypothetical protein
VTQLEHVRCGGVDLVEQHGDRAVAPGGHDRAPTADRLGPDGIAVDRADLLDRQWPDGVEHRLGDRVERSEQGLRRVRVAQEGHAEVRDEAATHRRRDDVEVGQGQERDGEGQLVRCTRRGPAERREQLGAHSPGR